MLLNKNTVGLRQYMLIETEENRRSCAYKSAQECLAHTCNFHLSPSVQRSLLGLLFEPPAFPPQVPLVSMARLGTAGPAREDLRGHWERPATPGRQDLQASRGIVRQPCAWLHQHTHPQGYRRQEQLKDPIFRSVKFHLSALKSRNRREGEERETTLLSRTTLRLKKQQGLCPLLHQFFNEWDTLLS